MLRRTSKTTACLLLMLLGGTSLAMGASERQSDSAGALERYRPLLRYDLDEAYFAQPVSHSVRVIDVDLIYGRDAYQDGEHWLQYWLFYAYNTQDRGILRTGRHEGDWEFVQLRLGRGGKPDAATFAQHSWAEACSYAELDTQRRDGVDVPVVYVANGSHSSYPRPGTADRPWPDPNDEAGGEGRAVRPRLRRISDFAPDWVRDPAPWGASRAGIVPGEQSSPDGPRFKDDRRWQRPASYDRDARSCGAGPPGRPWQTPAFIAAILGVGTLVWLTRRRSLARRN